MSNQLIYPFDGFSGFLTETLLAVHSHTRLCGADIANPERNIANIPKFADFSKC